MSSMLIFEREILWTEKKKIIHRFSTNGLDFLISYYDYYVFQYSTGFSAASALAEKIVHGSQEDKDKYLDYLKAGNSDYPLNVIKKQVWIWRKKTT